MKIAMFNTRKYDREFFDAANAKSNHHELVYLEASLDKTTASLAEGIPAACIFVNDKVLTN